MPFSTARTRNGPNAVAPLWHTRPIGPVRPDAPREEAVAQMSCLTFASPRQLGPVLRMPEARANSPNPPCKERGPPSARLTRSASPRCTNGAAIGRYPRIMAEAERLRQSLPADAGRGDLLKTIIDRVELRPNGLRMIPSLVPLTPAAAPPNRLQGCIF